MTVNSLHVPVVVLDACVLYSGPLRDLLMWLATEGHFAARWSERILEEWVRNRQADQPELEIEQLRQTCRNMNRWIPDALVSVNDDALASIDLPDEDDRHVVVTAMDSGATSIVTFNLRDFPEPHMPKGIRAVHPDEFLQQCFAANTDGILDTMKKHRGHLKKPVKTVEEYLAALNRSGPLQFVALVRPFADRI
jgi:predicted nucleic acid-binding protein